MRALPVLASWVLLTAATVSPAATEVTRAKTIAAKGVASLVLEAGVGGMRIEQGSGNAIEASVTLRAKRNTGIFTALPDVEKLDISATMRGDQLTLKVDSKNIEEQWVVRVPPTTLSAMELKLGVGDVAVSAAAKRLEVDVGVGDVNVDSKSGSITLQVGTGGASIRTSLANAGEIDGKSGVGSVSLKGLEGTVKSKAVGGSVSGKGRGQEPIEARVGVGSVEITLYE